MQKAREEKGSWMTLEEERAQRLSFDVGCSLRFESRNLCRKMHGLRVPPTFMDELE